MRDLSSMEISNIFGAGTLAEPITNPGSEWGRMVNDAARGLNDFGHWLGGAIADIKDSIPVPELPVTK